MGFKTTIQDLCFDNILSIKQLVLNKNFKYLQISDIDTTNGLSYIQTETNFLEIPDRATYVLKNNDVCISTVRPNRNAVALIYKPKRLIGTSGFAILRLKNNKILPEFLYVFCKTTLFVTKMLRHNTASLYPAVLNSDILNCKIPILPMDFQLKIKDLVQTSHKHLETSKALYKEAENLLYAELGLDINNPLKSILDSKDSLNFQIKQLKDSFLTTGRLDSEYYQKKI